MGDSTSNRANHTTSLCKKFESEKHHLSSADVRSKAVKNPHDMAASPSNNCRKQQMEEIVRHMSNLPSYLERGKPIQDRALNFGVMDWGRLEKWQYQHHKHDLRGNNKHSPSSSNSSYLFSTDGSSPYSSRGRSSSPAPPKPLHVASEEIITPYVKSRSGNVDKFQDFEDARNLLETKTRGCKTNESKSSEGTASCSSSKRGAFEASKQRSISPLRRFSFSTSSKSAAPTKRAESPPVSRNLTKDNTSVSRGAHSSPLRRLLDPLFPSRTPPEDSKTKAKVKLDLKSCKDVGVHDSCTNKMNESSSTKQALFQTAVKNGRPLFTFAVDDNRDILAATVRSFSGKDGGSGWIYTFFTVQEVVKKKTAGWLSQGGKGKDKDKEKGHGFVPNVAAQMKVSNSLVSSYNTREFVLFSADPSRLDRQVAAIEPKDELAAIIVHFLEVGEEGNHDSFSTTVVLPGGHHGVPSKGEPSPLIERWRSGGACDCGGWDMGCRLRTLTNQARSSGSNSPEVHMTADQFELFFLGEVVNERPFFSLSPLKEGIFSVEYNSSLTLLHAFSICISVMECRKSSQHTELRTYVAKQVDEEDEAPVTCASLPPVSLVERV